LFRVDAAGGEPTAISTLDAAAGERSHRWPDVLPDGTAALFAIAYQTGNPLDDASVALLDLATGEHEVLIRNAAYPRYTGDGHLLYIQNGDLFAVPFDPATRTIGGTPRLVQEQVRSSDTNGGASYSVSRRGDLIYLQETRGDQRVPLVWVDRDGSEELLPAQERDYGSVRLAPGPGLIFAEVSDPSAAVWVYDLTRETLSPLTTRGVSYGPVSSPDGQQVAFEAIRDGLAGIMIIAADGTDEHRLTSTTGAHIPTSWAPDGSTIAYMNATRDRPIEVWGVDPEDGDSARALLTGDYNVGGAVFSPDSQWMAYVSDESGRMEVYLRPYPALDARYAVSNAGGRAPVWSRDGSELFFVTDEGLMSVAIDRDPELRISRPQLVFARFFPHSVSGLAYDQNAHYDVAPDGRFLMPRISADTGPPPIARLVLGFTTALAGR
jgi:Tol biopolymer transport system component